MASTYRFQEAVNGASNVLPKGVGDLGYLACNMALAEVWNAFDWRQSIGDLPPFYLIPNVQDYGAPGVAVPADFKGLRRCFHWHIQDGGERCTEVIPVADLAEASSQYAINRDKKYICYHEPSRKFRILPVPDGSMGAPYHLIDGKYKKVPTVTLASGGTVNKINANNIANAIIPFDDAYLTVMVEAMRWAFMVLSNNPNAGPTQIQGTSKSHGGQKAVMMAAIAQMAKQERVDLGNRPVFPAEPLFSQNYGGWGGW